MSKKLTIVYDIKDRHSCPFRIHDDGGGMGMEGHYCGHPKAVEDTYCIGFGYKTKLTGFPDECPLKD